MSLSSLRTRLLFCFSIVCIIQACFIEPSTPNLASLSHIQANSLLLHKDQLIIAGTAKDSGNLIQIKSPFVMVFDTSLIKQSQHFFKTITTALNPQIIQPTIDETLLSYYRAESLSNQTEISELIYLNDTFKLNKTLTYGNRTRIQDLILDQNESIITLNYERSTQENSLQFINNKQLRHSISFSESDETNIPTSLISLQPYGYAFSGIAHGFQYPDGHDYKNSKTYGYIIKTNSQGQETNRYTHHGDGHVFINELKQNGPSILAVGTYQSTNTGMDMMLLILNQELKLQSETVFPYAGVQEALFAAKKDNKAYIAGTSEDLVDHTMKCRLLSLDANHKVIWSLTIEESGSWTPQDMIVHNNKLILLVESKSSRIASPTSHIYIVSLTGDIHKTTKIN